MTEISPGPVLVVTARRYNGHELWVTLGVLQEADIPFEVVSTHHIIADEKTAQSYSLALTIQEIPTDHMSLYRGLIFISGNTQDTELYWMHPRALDFVTEANSLNLPIAAICCSVPIIRGVTQNKKVSCYPLLRVKQLMEEAGALIQSVSISLDGNLLTAENEMATQLWAESFVQVLKGDPVTLTLIESNFEVSLGERALHPRLERIRGTDTSYRDKKGDI